MPLFFLDFPQTRLFMPSFIERIAIALLKCLCWEGWSCKAAAEDDLDPGPVSVLLFSSPFPCARLASKDITTPNRRPTPSERRTNRVSCATDGRFPLSSSFIVLCPAPLPLSQSVAIPSPVKPRASSSRRCSLAGAKPGLRARACWKCAAACLACCGCGSDPSLSASALNDWPRVKCCSQGEAVLFSSWWSLRDLHARRIASSKY